jgi:uncharacterized protein (TIGR02217 family)
VPSNLLFNFPVAPSGSWAYPIQQTPTYATVTKTSANGIRTSVQLRPYPIWNFQFTLGYLKGNASAATAYRDLLGFFMAMGGSANSFLYLHPTDNMVTPTGTDGSTAGFLGLGDGATTSFQLKRQIGIGEDIVQNPITVTPYINGTPVPASFWTLNYAGILTFNTAPSGGSVIQWGGQFYYRLQFLDDVIDDLQMIFYDVWNATIKLQSVILPG